MIQINGVYKNIGNKQILKSVNLNVNKGSIFGIIGENGAGKTTLIKCLTGIYQANSGKVKVNGEEVFENNKVKDKIGYVADESQYPSSFKVSELIKFYSMTYKNFSLEKFKNLNKVFNIPENKRMRELSKGMKMRVSLMFTLSIGAEVLILDEPTSGLDPIIKRELMNILMEEVSDNNTTIFISSHHLNDIERICDHIAMIEDGEIKYSNSIEELKNKVKKLQVVFKNRESALQSISSWHDIINIENLGRVDYIITNNYSKKLEVDLVNLGAEFVEQIDLSLEDMFIYSARKEDNNEKSFA